MEVRVSMSPVLRKNILRKVSCMARRIIGRLNEIILKFLISRPGAGVKDSVP